MMQKFTVKFLTLEDVNNFIAIVDKFPEDIDACVGRYTVDAKSVLALLSIGMSTAIDIFVHTDDSNVYDQIIMQCKNYIC